jgi:hypothetical protein
MPASSAAGLTLPQTVLLLQPVLRCWAAAAAPADNPSTSTSSTSSTDASNKAY